MEHYVTDSCVQWYAPPTKVQSTDTRLYSAEMNAILDYRIVLSTLSGVLLKCWPGLLRRRNNTFGFGGVAVASVISFLDFEADLGEVPSNTNRSPAPRT